MNYTKAEKKRDLILNGNLLKTIFAITLPLIVYNLIIYFYGIFDTVIVATYGIGKVESVAFIEQIRAMISTFGTAISVGGSIIVARRLGAKKDDEAKNIANNIFFTEVIVCFLIILIFIPFGRPFLSLLVPQEIINDAYGYFLVQIVALVIGCINGTFIGLEKAKGNTSILFILNVAVVIIKVSLALIFVLVFLPFERTINDTFPMFLQMTKNYGISTGIIHINNTWIALSTLIAQLFLFTFGLFYLFRKDNPIRIKFKKFKFDKVIIKTIFALSLPIFFGKFLFSFGKVFINSQASSYYLPIAVGALAISNTISGFVTNITLSFEDASSAIISQNVGQKNLKRAIDTFKLTLFICIGIGIILPIILIGFANPIASFFAPMGTENYLERRMMIEAIFKLESLGIIFLAIEAASFGVLYGFGKTKATMVVSIMRLFIFRIPPLLLMMYVLQVDYTALGWSTMISNTFAGIISLVIALIFLYKINENRSIFHFPDFRRYHKNRKDKYFVEGEYDETIS